MQRLINNPPVVDAAIEVPVVCSNATSLPEVIGDAAIAVDPRSPGDAAQAIKKITEDESLRKNLINKGKVNAERFAWEKQIKLYWDTIFQ